MSELLKEEEFLWQKWTSMDFFRYLQSDFPEIHVDKRISSDVKFAIKLGLQPVAADCTKCKGRYKLIYRKDHDSILFRCHKCKTSGSPFEGTFKGKFGKISWGTIFSFIWHLICIECTLSTTCLAVGVSCRTAVDWANFVRHVMMISFYNLSQTKIGGPGKIVEIDETTLSKRKNEKGRISKATRWVVGGICRDDNSCFVCKVNDRSEVSLNWVISKFVNSGSIVYTDEWKGYNHINDLEGVDIKHETVKCAENFVDPVTGVHTQKIKRLWRCLKNRKNLPTHYTEDLSDSYLYAFMYKKILRWEKLKPGERFELFLRHLGKIYPGAGHTPIWKEPETVPSAPKAVPKNNENQKRKKEEMCVKSTGKVSSKIKQDVVTEDVADSHSSSKKLKKNK
ncbi:uncharacterized protein LOC111618018 [Centruroides sculpturatus]|uniref:uncharacterized protein LOC111618018 n=1 Tax=Centruroides sculpturatus TaxID=218467 RepID=UPI000C6D903D|nr:uncharacterized protein LOC111618018 [Centruroides sculpturatus]XP_023215215.1 uncharacterized protein LOC111618018 [Centruroides sculpturatus]